MRRRTFLKICGSAFALPAVPPRASAAPEPPRKKILVLGGTNFLGPAVVERALERGHEVTIFNRGITRPHLFPNIEKLRGERHIDGGDLSSLQGDRRWDAVIDVWPEHSQLVRHTTSLLNDRTEFYVFCSSIAVYTDFSRPGLAEDAPVHVNDPGWYGGEKVLAEQVVQQHFPGAFAIPRCHAILGPRDDGAAYHYWLRKLATEEEVLAPGDGNDPVQFVDVRDVARWMIECVEERRVGIHNICGPEPPQTFKRFLEGSRSAIASDARLAWVEADFLRNDQGIQSFTNMPLWAPLDEDAGFYQVDGSKANAAGMRYRPLPETARDAWRWFRSYNFRETSFPLQGLGISRERERAVLAAWHDRK